MLGDHNLWGKTVPWTGSVTVPLICSGVALGVQSGAVITTPVGNMDLAGTFLDYAGQEPAPGMVTQSLRPFLEGSASNKPQNLARQQNAKNEAVTVQKQPRPYILSGLNDWRLVIQEDEEGGTELWKFICCNSTTCAGGYVPHTRSSSSYPVSHSKSGPLLERIDPVQTSSASSNVTFYLFDIRADPQV